MNDRGPLDLALRALRDMGVIRVRLGAVPPGYQQLQKRGAISAKRAGEQHADIRLNDAGRALAAQLKPWRETSRG